MKLNSLSFKGVYDIRFPKGTKSEFIDEKCKQAQDYIKKNYTNKDGKSFLEAKTLDWFDITKSDKILEDKGIRVSSTVDNPYILCDLFDKLDKRLGQEYVNKAKVELILDTQA